jgi:serine/threonine-protein kinase
VADLEEALAIEAARSGTSTGEATAVIRTLPAHTRRRLPFRMRHPISLLAVIALFGVGAAIVALIAKEGPKHIQRGTGPGKVSATPAGTKVVSVASASAHDYDPLGDDAEHSEEAPRVVDRDPGTVWTTESYSDGIEGAGKPGVGIYVDAKPKVDAVQLQVQTPDPGWKATIYAAPAGNVPHSVPGGWKKLAGGTVDASDKRFRLDTGGTAYRYYLVWITQLAPDSERAEISEIRLFQKVAA